MPSAAWLPPRWRWQHQPGGEFVFRCSDKALLSNWACVRDPAVFKENWSWPLMGKVDITAVARVQAADLFPLWFNQAQPRSGPQGEPPPCPLRGTLPRQPGKAVGLSVCRSVSPPPPPCPALSAKGCAELLGPGASEGGTCWATGPPVSGEGWSRAPSPAPLQLGGHVGKGTRPHSDSLGASSWRGVDPLCLLEPSGPCLVGLVLPAGVSQRRGG